MFAHPIWSNTRNFSEDTVTHHMRMHAGTLPWQSRAYVTNAFPSYIHNAGFKVYHNVNPAEDTVYAAGLAIGDPQQILSPDDLHHGFIFDGTDVFLVCEGLTITLPEQNEIYEVRFDSTDSLKWLVDGTVVHTCTTTLSFPYHYTLIGHTAFQTDLETMVNLDGIDRLRVHDIVYDVEYVDATDGTTIHTTEVSVFGNANVPSTTQVFKVKLESNVDPTTVFLGDNVLVQRLVRVGEDPSDLGLPETATRVPVNAECPYNWSTNSELHIFILALDEGDTMQFTIGSEKNPIFEFVNDGTSTPGVFETKTAVFKLEGSRPIVESEEELGEFFNDIYFKTRHLSSLIDIDEIIYKASDYFDFEYKVTEYDAENDEYNKVYDPVRDELGFDDTNRVIRFENQQTIEELFVKQYLPEYVNYMKDVNRPPTIGLDETESEDLNSPVLIIDQGELKDLKNLLFKNITLMNYFKGNKIQMEFLISIFSSSLGWHYISVDPDPYHNFIYRVSTTMPERFWNENIRHITHPLGWDDLYVFVPRDAIHWHQVQILDSTQAETYFLRHLESPEPTYIDWADYLDSTTWVETFPGGYVVNRNYNGNTVRFGNFAGNAILDDFIQEKTFPFKVAEYTADVEYDNHIFEIGQDGTSVASDATSGLFHEIRTTYPVYDATVDTTTGQSIHFEKSGPSALFKSTRIGDRTWKFEFGKTGLAGEYIWEIYRSGILIAVYRTHIPVAFHVGRGNEKIDVILRLKMKNMNLPAFSVAVENRADWLRKIEKLGNPVHESYLDQLASSKTNRHDGGAVGDYGKPVRYPVNDGDYQGEIDEALIAQVAADVNLWAYPGNIFYTFWNDDTSASTGPESYRNQINGIFTEFLWTIREGSPSGNVINTIRTTIPQIVYEKPAGAGLRNIECTLIRGDIRIVCPSTQTV